MKDHLDPARPASLDQAGRMDGKYRLQRHVYDATRKYFLFGRDQAIAALEPSRRRTILEIGCGTGRNIANILSRTSDARLFGIDISSEMLKSAGSHVGASARVTLARADAETFDPEAVFGRTRFDAVLMSYCLSMIPDWQAALARGLASVAPGGRLVAIDFGRFERYGPMGPWFTASLIRHLATPRPDLQAVMDRIAATSGPFTIRHRSRYGGYAQLSTADRTAA